jgi:hypothetical protein
MLAALAVAAIAVVAFLVLRGGGGGTEVTHAELVERANAACARLARENAALEAPPFPYDSQAEPFFLAVGDNVVAVEEELGALSPPGEDAGALDRLVDRYDRIGVELEKLQTAAAVEQGQEMVTVIDEIGDIARETVATERELGVCPGETSVQVSVAAEIRRTRPNPLAETGPLTE